MDISYLKKCNEALITYGRMIKFSHTFFALPFALSAVILAGRQYPIQITDLVWVLVAMVGARSAAMGFNRIVDVNFDAANPRTSQREIPRGEISKASAALFVVLFGALFVFASAMLGSLCFYLSFPVLGLLFLYSYTKRFTAYCHLYLGFVISLAPVGAWIAITQTFVWPVMILSFSLMTHIAGFDILYACQDADFDKKQRLFSIPARLGVTRALQISAVLHLFSFLSLILLSFGFDLGRYYLGCVGIIGTLFIIEHKLINPADFSKINIAFFHINSSISFVLLLGVAMDTFIR